MAVSVLCGVLCGLIGSLPAAILFEGNLKRGRRVGVGIGIGAVVCSFAFLSAAVAVGYVVLAGDVLVFVVPMLVSYLTFWAIETARAWHGMSARR